MNRYLSLALLLFAMVCPAIANAGTLKGKVTDTKGEELPFATVFIQGTANGTAANADGEYILALPAGSYKVTCQYMGFKAVTFNVNFAGNETVVHNFSLQDQSMQMKDVVVHANAEDPAYAIIRKAIKRRAFHLDQVRSFQASIYLKGVFRLRDLPKRFLGQKVDKEDAGSDSAGRGVLYLCEEEADYYSRGDKERTVIKAVRESGDPNGLGLSQMPPIVTFYENNVQVINGISPRGFVSPISENAIYYYKYKYEGAFMENGYMVDKIKVIPRRLYEPLFHGTIYIAEEDWAIHSLDLWLNSKSNMELLDTLNIRQVHLPLGKDEWVVKSQVLYPTIKLFGFDVTGNFVTVYNKQKINEPIPDSLFNKRIASSYDADANKKDTSYWHERPVPLENDEARDYVKRDSVRVKNEDPNFQDSIRRRRNRFKSANILQNGFTWNTKRYKNTISTNSILGGMVGYNTVEGLNVLPKVNWLHRLDTGNYLDGKIAARYGFSNKHFNAIARLEYRHNSRIWIGRQWQLGVEGGKYVFQLNPNSTVTPFYNTFTTLLQGENYMKIYERWNGALYLNKNYGNGFKFNIRLDYQHRIPLENTTDFTFAKTSYFNDNKPAPLAAVPFTEHDAALVNIGISYQPGYQYTLYPNHKTPLGSNKPVFTLQYEKGIPNIFNSVSDFDKWRFDISDNMNLKLFGSMSYRVAVGGFLNDKYVSIPDMMHLADNQLILAAPFLRSFQLAPYYKYSNTEPIYGELHLEYYMKGLLTNKIPLLRQARWYLVAGTNTFYANSNKYYAEAFAGVDNLGYKAIRFLRIDFVYSWNSMNQTNYGIRIGIDPSSVFKFTTSNAGEDW